MTVERMLQALWNGVGGLGGWIILAVEAVWRAPVAAVRIRAELNSDAEMIASACRARAVCPTPRGVVRLGVAAILAFGPLFEATALFASDVKARLNSNDGSTSFQVRDSGDNVVGSVDSKGNLLVIGSGTVTTGFSASSAVFTVTGSNASSIGLTVSSSALFATSGGLFGIGTASPLARFHLQDGQLMVRGAAVAPFLILDDAGSGAAMSLSYRRNGVEGGALFLSGSDFVMQAAGGVTRFKSDATNERMRIMAGGNIGLGTAAPGARVHVSSAAAYGGNILLVSTGTSNLFQVNGSSIQLGLPLYFPDGSVQTTAGSTSNSALLNSTQTFSGQNTFNNQVTISSNIVIGGTGGRFLADFSNGTISNRFMFQSSTLNGMTSVGVTPNGTGTEARWSIYANSDSNNAAYGSLKAIAGSTEIRLEGGATGTGPQWPLTVFTNNTERMRFTSSGNMGMGTAAPGARVHVSSAAAYGGNILLVSTGTSNLFQVNGSSIQLGLPLYFPDGSVQTAASAGSNAALLNSTQTFSGLNTFNNHLTAVSSMSVLGTGLSGTIPVFQVMGGTLSVLANGNVGIGSSNPASRLDIASGGTNKQHILMSGNATGGAVVRRGADTGYIEMWGGNDWNTGGTLYLNGNNWTPSGEQGRIQFQLGLNTARYDFLSASAASNLMVLNGAGNLGLGTVAPLARVHVSSAAAYGGNMLLVSTGTTNLFEVNGSSIQLGVPLYFPDGTSQTTASGLSNVALLVATQTFSGQNTFMNLVNTSSNVTLVNGNIGIGSADPAARLAIQSPAGSSFDQLTISTGSRRIMTVTGYGNVGIGTVTPLAPLHIAYDSDSVPTTSYGLRIDNVGPGGVNNQAEIFMQPAGGLPAWAISANDNFEILRIYNGSQARFAIDGGGRTGIGTTTMLGTLHISSAVASVAPLMVLSTGTTRLVEVTSSSVAIRMGGNTVIVGGNVGVGTENPSSRFEVVNGSISVNGTGAGIMVNGLPVLTSGSGGTGATLTSTQTFSGQNTFLNMVTIATTAYVTGNLGLGTASTNATFHIRNYSDQMMIEDSDGGADAKKWLFKADSNNFNILTANDAFNSFANAFQMTRSGVGLPYVSFPTGNVGVGTTAPTGLFQVGTGTFTVLSNGNVGIGTAGPGALLTIFGGATVDNGLTIQMGAVPNIRLARTDASARTYILRTDTDAKFKIIDETASGAPKRFTIDTAGYVGIGTDAPTTLLHVSSGAAGAGPQFIISTGTTKLFEVTGSSMTIGVGGNVIITGNRVGVGTTNPTAPWHVLQNQDAYGFIVEGPNQNGSPLFGLQNIPLTTGVGNGKAFEIKAAGEANGRGMFYSNGAYGIGPGNTLRDVFFRRYALNTMMIDSDMVGGTAHFLVTGNIGTGTTAPSSRFEVVDGSITVRGTNAGISINGNPVLTSAGGGTGAVLTSTQTFSGQNTFNNMVTIATTAYVSGNLGIGTATPTNANAHINTLVGNTGLRVGSASPLYLIADYPHVGFNTYYNTAFRYGTANYAGYMGMDPTTGRIFIGNTSVSGAADATATINDRISIINNGNVGVGTTAPTGLFQVGTGTLTVLSNGNVGVGTDAPSAKFQVFSGAIRPAVGNATTAGLYFPTDPGGGSGDTAFIRYYVESGENTKLRIGTDNDADDDVTLYQGGADRLTVRGGNVGIGTDNPGSLLQVGVATLSVLSGGNLGVGTTAPTSKFDVLNGSITVRGTNAGISVTDGQYGGDIVNKGSVSGSVTIDWNDGNTQHVTLTGATTLTFSNGISGRKYTLIVKQDGTGSRTVTWPGTVRWAGGGSPTLTSTASKTDYIGFIYNSIDSTYDSLSQRLNF